MPMTQIYISRLLLMVLACLLFQVSADAATSNSSLNISITVPSSAILTLGSTSLRFIPDDPTVQPSVPAQENPVSVLATTRSRGIPSLAVIASDDLTDGANIIPVTAISWTADATPYIAGTMNKSTAQAAALFTTGSGSFQSSFRYFLANSPLYVPGTYSTTINYTLTAP